MTPKTAPPGAAAAGAPAAGRRSGRWLAVAGAVAFAVSIGGYLGYDLTHPAADWRDPVDLQVYREAGFVARGLTRLYDPHVLAPLYHWPPAQLPFTYPPFAAMAFTAATVPSFGLLWWLATGADIAAVLATIWLVLGALGHRRGAARLGVTLLLAAAALWTEPVQRTLFLGQIEIGLMFLVIWDQCQPDRRWWKGAGIGLAAGIKLVPLIFIPYLLLTRRFRQAAVALAVFAATIAAGFGVLPGDSRAWWLNELFLRGGRTGFVGWEGNQSLQAIITRLSGSIAGGQHAWLLAAAGTAIAGLACAVVLDRRVHPLAGLLTVALTGLLISPISWDHHWVWIVPGLAVIVHYAAKSRWRARAGLAAVAVLVMVAFAAWPGSIWNNPNDLGGFSEGVIWAPPNTDPFTYFARGDQPGYVEYHWHGFELITGNAFILTGMALFVLLLAIALSVLRRGTGRVRQTATETALKPQTAAPPRIRGPRTRSGRPAPRAAPGEPG